MSVGNIYKKVELDFSTSPYGYARNDDKRGMPRQAGHDIWTGGRGKPGRYGLASEGPLERVASDKVRARGRLSPPFRFFQENLLNLLTIGISKTILQCTSV